MSVDVEEYYHAHSLEQQFPRDIWNSLEGRAERSTNRLLDMFDEFKIKSTFFVLGTVAERFPSLIREMVQRGHEVASHGLDHHRAYDQEPKVFHADISTAKSILEDTIGIEVMGYRAASFSIGPANWWAYDVLEEVGYKYSSSLCNGRFDRSDIAIPASPFIPARGNLVEIPVTTVPVFNRQFPTGGGSFRLLPYSIFKNSLGKAVNSKGAKPLIFYCHPWEIDPSQPVAKVNLKTRWRHYGNLGRMEKKLARALSDFSWGRMKDVFEDVINVTSNNAVSDRMREK
ncbi:DUF3473 domain-containing protein [Sneathiella sp. DP05]|uniref:Chitooligosaccharide deacetylase n=2 Tax=Sneathiella litorea TaxID=2606216 RepID=A0A6L8WBF7_9PROT|nr:DUF3473 domain-containing protein [Sneathiella litorea]